MVRRIWRQIEIEAPSIPFALAHGAHIGLAVGVLLGLWRWAHLVALVGAR